MVDIKRDFVRNTVMEIMSLPDDQLNYVIGVMNGILISRDLKEVEKKSNRKEGKR